MEKVFPVETTAVFSRLNLRAGKGFRALTQVAKEGLVEKVLEPGCFVVVLGDGSKITVRGSESLRPGSRVRVLPGSSNMKESEAPSRVGTQTAGDESGFQWTALIPLAFGGRRAEAHLEVFVERRVKGLLEKGILAVYFVFTVQTEAQGEIQWSIYIRGKQVTLQVHAPRGESEREGLKNLILEIEKSLKKRGFLVSGPTIILNRPFKAPEGFRLNVKG